MNASILFIAILTLTLLLIAYLAAGRWLQHRSAWLTHHAEVDAVYVLAGAATRCERMDALLDWIRKYDCRPAIVLIPEDRAAGSCPNEKGELIPIADWQVERLGKAYSDQDHHRNQTCIAGHKVTIVPGHYHGTDGEMQALATYLESRPNLRRVALITSRSHIRRALKRARTHIDDPRIIGVLPTREAITDYVPRRVFTEYLQLLRDQFGLTHAPFLHRGWWMQRVPRAR